MKLYTGVSKMCLRTFRSLKDWKIRLQLKNIEVLLVVLVKIPAAAELFEDLYYSSQQTKQQNITMIGSGWNKGMDRKDLILTVLHK